MKSNDFVLKAEDCSANRKGKGKRQYLVRRRTETYSGLDKYSEKSVTISRMRRGVHQEIETLISKGALLFAKYLRDEKQTWNPRIVGLT